MEKKYNNKDFGSLFITNTSEKINKINNNEETIIEVSPLDCFNWKYADRQSFEMGDLHELASNISENGQVQPVIVRASSDGKYEVIAGERRWRACSIINKKIKVVVKNISDEDAFLLQNAENIKQGLCPYSESISYHKVLLDEKISQRELAKRLGISKSSLNNLLSFSAIPNSLWDAVGDMRKVTVKTACYIKKILDDNYSSIDELIEIATHIQKGAGTSKIKKLLDKSESTQRKVVFSDNNRLLFKIEDDKIILPTQDLDEFKLQSLIEHLKIYLEKSYS
jgi:ParB family transcriptional regulator, chromosome partitioning protein